MTLDKLKLLKVRLLLESKHKQRMRRENQRFFIPSDYYLYGVTKRDLFKRELKREIRELGGENMIEFYLDKFTIGDFEELYETFKGEYEVRYEKDKIIIKLLKELREEMGDNERGNKSNFGYEEKTAKR